MCHAATQVPFKCPQCPHFAENREKLLRHVGFYHKAFAAATVSPDDQMKIEPTDAIDAKVETAAEKSSTEGGGGGAEDTPKTSDAQSAAADAAGGTPISGAPEIKDEIDTEVMEKEKAVAPFGGGGGQQCLMCDDCRTVGTSTTDFHKHLCDVHFKDRLVALVQTVQGGRRIQFSFATSTFFTVLGTL